MSKLHLRVFDDKSELVYPDGRVESFLEGPSSQAAQQRHRAIYDTLGNGYLSDAIETCKQGQHILDHASLALSHTDALDELVKAITSEVGRALVGIVILQLCIKGISPAQSIRLHKGGRNSRDFSWQDGISMRVLDSKHITPTLRKYGLVSLNKDGFMMTRSLAENYPYTRVYKANMRGARNQWLFIVEELELNHLDAKSALLYLLSKLLNKANEFNNLATNMLMELSRLINNGKFGSSIEVTRLMKSHMDTSNYAARIMEIAMHSLLQARQTNNALIEGELVPLSQMRSANKKHGNIGDIEIVNGVQIIKSWDAKYGIAYLRDQVEELVEKLQDHPDVTLVGFVTSVEPDRPHELSIRIEEIAQLYGVELEILTFDQWVINQFEDATSYSLTDEKKLAASWVIAYAESLAQRRTSIAPIDEPCYQWVESLMVLLTSRAGNPDPNT